MVDYATRYPEAVALKHIDTESVAEALISIFSRVGIPKETLSNCGTQFTSEMMKEVSRLLSLKQLTTTPYHPICNGLVENFNGTLKNMLRKLCEEKPKDWDRFVAPLLFAYREVPQSTLGFSPFELLYGRSVRGPIAILKELWTSEKVSSDVKLTYQYVTDLKDRLMQTTELVQENLLKKDQEYKHYYDRKSRRRTFKPGDKVLLLLPTSQNKLLMQWKGPFTIQMKVGINDYKVELPTGVKVFHANLLKYYHTSEAALCGLGDVKSLAIGIVENDDSKVDSSFNFPVDSRTKNYNDVVVNPVLSPQQHSQLVDLLQKYSDIFTDVRKVTNLLHHSIPLTTTDPIRSRPYPVPLSMRGIVKDEVDKMLRLGVIEPSTASYASPIVLVKKKDNTIRCCIDYRKINKICHFDPMPTPLPEYLYSKLSSNKFFSKLDLSKGYWQIPIKEEDRDKTTFVTPDCGLFHFKVVPFGLVTSAASCNRMMQLLLQGLENTESYVDDILSYDKDWKKHLVTLEKLFDALRSANLSVRPSKCMLGFGNLEFLGHNFGVEGLFPCADKVGKISEAPCPKTTKELCSFLGLVGYYRKFIPHFSDLSL